MKRKKPKISIVGIELKFYQWTDSVKYAFQRMKKGYSDGDVSGMDEWFLRIAPGMLRELKENCGEELFDAVLFCNRHPQDYTDLPHDETGMIKPTEEQSRQILAQWRETLERMAVLFEKASRHSHFCFLCEEAQMRRQYLDEAFRLFSKYFNDLWR